VRPGPRGLLLGIALAALSGLLVSLAHPPADVGAVAFVGLVPLLTAIRGGRVPGRVRGADGDPVA
jgi:apolipoprotein N-acyltransferase